jgi:uncharacterized protein YdiU (UPF0061 family)
MNWRLEHSYQLLPGLFFTEVEPTLMKEPRVVLFNHALAAQLGLGED